MITSNDMFYAAKGPGEWHSCPKYIGQLSSAPKARKEVHTPDDCGRMHSLPVLLPEKSGATKTEAETEVAHLPFCKALKESHFSSTLNAFHELEMGVGLLFSSSIYQRACCHPVGSFSNQNAFPSTDFFSPIMRRSGCAPEPSCITLVPSSLRGSSRARLLPKKCTPSIRADSKHAFS